MLLGNLIEHLMSFNGFLQITFKNLFIHRARELLRKNDNMRVGSRERLLTTDKKRLFLSQSLQIVRL